MNVEDPNSKGYQILQNLMEITEKDKEEFDELRKKSKEQSTNNNQSRIIEGFGFFKFSDLENPIQQLDLLFDAQAQTLNSGIGKSLLMVVVIFNEENQIHRTFYLDNRPYKKFWDAYKQEFP